MKKARRVSRELKRLAVLPDDEIDVSDIPVRKDWSGAAVGRFYRPVKKQVTLRIDLDVLEWFKARGGRYQTALNSALREHMARQSRTKRKAG